MSSLATSTTSAGLAAIAALDLGVIGRRIAPIRALPQAPQVGDHLVFGAVAAVFLERSRGRPC